MKTIGESGRPILTEVLVNEAEGETWNKMSGMEWQKSPTSAIRKHAIIGRADVPDFCHSEACNNR